MDDEIDIDDPAAQYRRVAPRPLATRAPRRSVWTNFDTWAAADALLLKEKWSSVRANFGLYHKGKSAARIKSRCDARGKTVYRVVFSKRRA